MSATLIGGAIILLGVWLVSRPATASNKSRAKQGLESSIE